MHNSPTSSSISSGEEFHPTHPNRLDSYSGLGETNKILDRTDASSLTLLTLTRRYWDYTLELAGCGSQLHMEHVSDASTKRSDTINRAKRLMDYWQKYIPAS